MTGEICRFGLIVTGRGEAKFLQLLFRSLMVRAWCSFEVIRRVGQLSPITSPKRVLKMVGRGGNVTPKDVENIGLPARGFLRQHAQNVVILVDDLEADRQPQAEAVFRRYRDALDQVLRSDNLCDRAAVHFLVNMLEAYYFAHAAVVNGVAGMQLLDADHPSDVEQIRNPKADLRQRWPGFDEIEHGEQIVGSLDLDHVLSRPPECCWLRAMFAWCVDKLVARGALYEPLGPGTYRLDSGCKSPLTYPQATGVEHTNTGTSIGVV
ncbi:MAG: hypothetical protein ACHRHE_09205 [Tepidisphaerales bacterium]